MTPPDIPPLYFALIPAAGVGARMQSDYPKQYLPLLGKPMLWHTVQVFLAHKAIAHVFVVVSPYDTYVDTALLEDSRLTILRIGGLTRAESVSNGLKAMVHEVKKDDWVLVHDAARPGLTGELISRLIDQLMMDDVGGILALPAMDTIKKVNNVTQTVETLPRENVWLAQTPQMFRYGLLSQALLRATTDANNMAWLTDEASAIEHDGWSPKLVLGDRCNTKITEPDDMAWVAFYMGHRRRDDK